MNVSKLQKYLEEYPKKVLVFDFDATLVTLNWPNSDQFEAKLRDYLMTVDREIASKYHPFDYLGYNTMIGRHSASVKKMIDKIYLDEEMREVDNFVSVNSPALDFIRDNKGRYTCHIWSNNQRDTVVAVLEKLKIGNLFKTIVSATDVSLYKPDPEGFGLMYDRLHEKGDYLMIGDSINDKSGASNSGIDYFYLSY